MYNYKLELQMSLRQYFYHFQIFFLSGSVSVQPHDPLGIHPGIWAFFV